MKVTAKRFLSKLGLDVRLSRNLQQMEKRTWEQRQNEMWAAVPLASSDSDGHRYWCE